MKKNYYIFILTACLIVCAGKANAQLERPFKHLGVSLSAGTLGGGLEAATSLTDYFTLRGGFTMLPFTYKYNYDEFENVEDYVVPIEAKLNLYHGKLLVDIHPFKNAGFHITGGFLVGKPKMITVSANSKEPIVIGDLEIEPDSFGNIEAWVKTNAIKPYVGIGFGRAIPKRRLGFMFELGAAFHGKPKVETNNTSVNEELKGEDFNDFNKIINKVTFYPNINFQLSYRIF